MKKNFENEIENELRGKIQKLVAEYASVKYVKNIFHKGLTPIQTAGKVIDGAEMSYMVDAALDGWLTAGRFNQEFEKKLAKYLGVNHLITVNSGSSANLVAFNTLTSSKLGEKSIKVGDEVITVAAGFPTTVNPAIQFGAIPVFIDVELGTYNIDCSKIENAITSKTKAIMLAHTLGNPFNLDVIRRICDKYNLWLIEDCCDALGATFNGKMVGTFGDISTLSFYPAHHITMGEGGAVFTNNLELKIIAESFRDWGRDCYCQPGFDNTCGKRFDWQLGRLPYGFDHKFTYGHAGYNLKITDSQAACGLAQLDKLNLFIKIRKSNFEYLRSKLESCEKYIILPTPTANSDPSWFGFPITLRENCPVNREELLKYLDQNKIGTRMLFAGNLTCQPYMIERQFRVSGELKNTNLIMNNTFWVGIYPGNTEEMLDFVASKISEYLGVSFE